LIKGCWLSPYNVSAQTNIITSHSIGTKLDRNNESDKNIFCMLETWLKVNLPLKWAITAFFFVADGWNQTADCA